MMNNEALKLQFITVLDSIGFGLIHPFLPPHLRCLGANYFACGVLSVGILLCQLISINVKSALVQMGGRRYALFLMLNIALGSHLLLILTDSSVFTMCSRFVFTLFNQSQSVCKDKMVNINQKRNESDTVILGILGASGYIIGPIVAGYIYSLKDGFFFIGVLVFLLTLTNIYLTMELSQDNTQKYERRNSHSVVEQCLEDTLNGVTHFRKSDYYKYWDIILFKFLFAASTTTFFTKFTMILTHNFQANSIMLGYTGAYQNFLLFISACALTYLEPIRIKNHHLYIMEYAIFIFGVMLLILCFAPYYELYVLTCIPTVFARSYINIALDDLFCSKASDHLEHVNNTMSVLAGVTVPLLFGIVADWVDFIAVVIFSVIPIIASLFIVMNYTRPYELTEEGESLKKD